METSYSVHFIGHLPLTFQSSRSKILSESVMSPMARRFLSRCPRLHLLKMVSGSPRALSSASVRGLFRYTARQGFRFAAPWARFSLPSAMQKSRVIPGVRSTSKSGPPARFFGGLTMRLLSTGPLHHIAGACRSATKSGLLLRSAVNLCYLIPNISHRHPGGNKANPPPNATKPSVILLRSSGLFIRQGWLPCRSATKSGLLLRSPFVTLLSSFQ